MSFTTADLLSSIERRSFMPTGQLTFTDAEILSIADEAQLNVVNPVIMGVREEFLVYTETRSIVANRNYYAIPQRSIGQMLRHVAILRGSQLWPPLPRIQPENLQTTLTGFPRGFYLQNNNVVLYPTPAGADISLQLSYFLRPAKLVETSATATITAIDTTTNTVTVDAVPSTWASGDEFDFTRGYGAQDPLGIDQVSTTVSAPDIIFTDDLPATLAVGDVVSVAGETSLVQLPEEFRAILAQATAFEILESSNQPGAANAAAKLAAQIEAVQKLLAPRTPGNPSKIKNRSWY
jgi:hypothetical protein